ncbi:MAG: DNA polymerase III subunit delta [Buchnera aphidicola (Nurudea yanoniella)]
MNTIHSEQIFPIFFKKLSPYYIIVGTEYFFIQESKKNIFFAIKKYGFSKDLIEEIEYNSQFKNLSSYFKTNNLFLKKRIIILNLSENLLTTKIKTKLSCLSRFINPNLLLIIYKTSIEYKEKKIWLNIFKLKGTIVYCNDLTEKKINIWMKNKEKILKINLHKNSRHLLLKYHSGNISSLCNTLNVLKLTWPHTLITVKKVQQLIGDTSIFKPQDWINAILTKNYSESIRILNNFFIKNYNQIVLIRHLQYNLLTILIIKFEQSNSIHHISKKINTKNKKYCLLIEFSKNTNIKTIKKLIRFLTAIEINIKKNYKRSIWNQLKVLSYIMSKNS